MSCDIIVIREIGHLDGVYIVAGESHLVSSLAISRIFREIISSKYSYYLLMHFYRHLSAIPCNVW